MMLINLALSIRNPDSTGGATAIKMRTGFSSPKVHGGYPPDSPSRRFFFVRDMARSMIEAWGIPSGMPVSVNAGLLTPIASVTTFSSVAAGFSSQVHGV